MAQTKSKKKEGKKAKVAQKKRPFNIALSEKLSLKQATALAKSIKLQNINPISPELFEANQFFPLFERLRYEDPVHFAIHDEFGPYWSLTKYEDILAVDKNHVDFSSEPSIVIVDFEEVNLPLKMFIAMDPPKHTAQRQTVEPSMSRDNMQNYEGLIRERTQFILDRLPVGKPFDWVKTVSIELTTLMLATLFDFPFDERHRLTRWSDVTTAVPGAGIVDTEEQRRDELFECLAYFLEMWKVKQKQKPSFDLISMLVHSAATKEMPEMEFLGNLLLLIVGGNDTTRNSMTGGVLAFNQFPKELDKLKKDPGLMRSCVAEIIRWQTPLAYMRRRATKDIVLRGKHIKKDERVLMWYVSGNRDTDFFEKPDDFIIDRPKVRQHLSYGFGIHRCVGERLADLQLQILWEEILKRFSFIEVLEPPVRVHSSFVKGYRSMMVKVHPK